MRCKCLAGKSPGLGRTTPGHRGVPLRPEIPEKERIHKFLPEVGLTAALHSKSSIVTSHTTVIVLPFHRNKNYLVVLDEKVTMAGYMYEKEFHNFRKEIPCEGRLVGIVIGSSIHAQQIFVKFAEAWRSRRLPTASPNLIEIANCILQDKDAIEVVNNMPVTYSLTVLDTHNSGYGHLVNLIFTPAYFGMEIPKAGQIFVTGSGKGPAIQAMVESGMRMGEDLSFQKTLFLGCEGIDGARIGDSQNGGYRRAFTADGSYLENLWIEGDDVQECGLPNN